MSIYSFLGGTLYSAFSTIQNLDSNVPKARMLGVALIGCGIMTFTMPEISNWKFKQSIATYNSNRNK